MPSSHNGKQYYCHLRGRSTSPACKHRPCQLLRHTRAIIKRRNPIAERLYQEFHQAQPHKRVVNVPEPRGPLLKIGRLKEIVYEPDAPSQLAGQEFQHIMGDFGSLLRHISEEKPVLATDGKNLFVIRGRSKYRFTRRGIVG